MEFKFPVTNIFSDDIVEVNHTLIPPGFKGDRRALLDSIGKVSEIVNAMGEASAAAQGLTIPITTADRLRNSEHIVYLLIDQQANTGRGAVTGMLKTGKKSLYLFDKNGQYYHVSPACVLDFYVHESRQRMGLGKQLYEHMLQKEQVEPVQMAIDRPSEKFLGFLNKHYSLQDPVKQMNNYVVFDDFFPKVEEQEPNGTVQTTPESGKKVSANGLQTYTSPLGRYGAPRPPCSMGQIIHNQTSTIQKSAEPTGDIKLMEEKTNSSPKLERPRSLSIQINDEIDADGKKIDNIESEVHDDDNNNNNNNTEIIKNGDDGIIDELSIDNVEITDDNDKSPNKRTPSHLTEKGYFDLKFYHNKLW